MQSTEENISTAATALWPSKIIIYFCDANFARETGPISHNFISKVVLLLFLNYDNNVQDFSVYDVTEIYNCNLYIFRYYRFERGFTSDLQLYVHIWV